MVTLSPGAGSEPHRHRATAESFGTDPARYDRSRAPYPQEMIDRIVAAAPGTAFLDVGCGTGIEARQFAAAGRTVLGVETDPRMAAFARETGIPVEVATFEKWEPDGRTFDAVVSGTAWHWIDPVAGAAKAASVLRPGGVLAPFGHVYQLPPAAGQAFAEAFRQAAPDSPFRAPQGSMLDAYRGIYDRAAAGIREAGGFEEPEIWRYDWKRPYTRSEILDLIPTSGGLTTMPPELVAQVLTAVEKELAEIPEPVTLRYTTWGLTAVRSRMPRGNADGR